MHERGLIRHPPGNLYDYQKERDAGGGVCMIIKTREIGKRDRCEAFELGSITLNSLARDRWKVKYIIY